MDVRCEKCLTVYDFDESQVTANGVTVKCTQCGNLFKVRRRDTMEIPISSAAARSPAYIPPGGGQSGMSAPRPRSTPARGVPAAAPPPRAAAALPSSRAPAAAPSPPARAAAPAPQAQPQRSPAQQPHARASEAAAQARAGEPAPQARAAEPAPPPRTPATAQRAAAPPPAEAPPDQLLVRLSVSGEVFRIYELASLKEWILARKLTPDDTLSRDGINWRPLRLVPELKPLFVQVSVPDEAPTIRDMEVPLELSTTAPMSRPEGAAIGRSGPTGPGHAPSPRRDDPSGPVSMGDPITHHDPAFTAPTRRVAAAADIPAVVDELAALDVPPRTRRWPWLLALGLLGLGGAGAYVGLARPDLVRALVSSGPSRAQRGWQAGREKFLTDTDDGFREAAALYQQAHGADGDSPLPLAGLAETQAAWAAYLRDDARSLEAQGPQVAVAVSTLRKEAQGHLDDAKRNAQEALALSPDSPEVNRAMADFLRVDGAPAAEVERYLQRAEEARPVDPEVAFVAGALAFRDGKLAEAQKKLEQAVQLGGDRPPVRALVLLGKLQLQAGHKPEAKQALERALAQNPQHERARALLAQIEGQPGAPVAQAAPGQAAPGQAAPGQAAPAQAAAAQAAPRPAGTEAKPVEEKPQDKPGEAVAGAGQSYNQLVAQADKLSERGKTDQARKLYEKALEQNAAGVEAITGLGYCDLDRERYSSAIERFKRALEVAPEYGDALIGIAESYKVQGVKGQALDYYKRYLRALPHGSKAEMAQKNIRDLDAHAEPRPERVEPKPESKQESKNEPKQESKSEPEPKSDSRDETAPGEPTPLPRLPAAPPADEPPPP